MGYESNHSGCRLCHTALPLDEELAQGAAQRGQKTIMDRLTEQILAIDAIDEVHVVTNHKFGGGVSVLGWLCRRELASGEVQGVGRRHAEQ